jgi:hypothetical protein
LTFVTNNNLYDQCIVNVKNEYYFHKGKGTGKGKVHLRTGHKDPKEE